MRILRGHRGRLRAVAYSPDGVTLATAGDDKMVKVWDVASGRERATLQVPYGRGCVALAFSFDGKWLAGAGLPAMVWSLAMMEPVPLQEHIGVSHSLVFTPRRDQLVCGLWTTSGDLGNLIAYDLVTGTLSWPFGPCQYWVDATACSPATNLLATASHEYFQGQHRIFIRLWGLDDYRQQAQIESHLGTPSFSQSIAFSPDGQLLASTGAKSVSLWNVSDRSRRGQLLGHTKQVNSVNFSPDGRTIATGSNDGTVRFWDVESLRQVMVFELETGKVNCVAFSPDGMTAAAVGERRKVIVWDVL